MRSKKLAVLVTLVACVSLVSCAGTKSPDMNSTLWGALGGSSGVSSLANSFGKQLMDNMSLSEKLGKQGVEQLQNGLYNSVGEAAGYTIPEGSDLSSALKKQNLDDASVASVGNSLRSAGRSQGLGSSEMSMLTGLWQTASSKMKM
jgi:hypothetical protein